MIPSKRPVQSRQHEPIRVAALMVCTRDRPQEIADCLASCAGLVAPPGARIVICVADNNEVPQEEAIRLVAAEHGLDLRYGYEPKRGYASVRNCALDLALGAGADIAVFIDDDSTADSGLVAEHAAAMERYGADAILGRIEGLSLRAREGHRVKKAGTGNVSMRRWVFDPVDGAGLRFDERLNLLGFEDFEFFADLIRAGGVIYQSTKPVAISRPTLDATPTSAARPFEARRAFATMEGRNEIAVTRMRHGVASALLRLLRRQTPQIGRGIAGLVGAHLVSLKDVAEGRAQRDAARIRLAKARAGFTGLWRPGYDRPMARLGRLVEVDDDTK